MMNAIERVFMPEQASECERVRERERATEQKHIVKSAYRIKMVAYYNIDMAFLFLFLVQYPMSFIIFMCIMSRAMSWHHFGTRVPCCCCCWFFSSTRPSFSHADFSLLEPKHFLSNSIVKCETKRSIFTVGASTFMPASALSHSGSRFSAATTTKRLLLSCFFFLLLWLMMWCGLWGLVNCLHDNRTTDWYKTQTLFSP